MITGPTPTEEEVKNLYSVKADKAELESLKADLLRIEGIVDHLDGEYSNEDSYDEYDDEDSQVEDVISLGEGGSGGKEDEDEEFFEGDDEETKKLADKAKELTQKSLPEIGELFGGRDHTTVLHAVRKIADERAHDGQLNHEIHVIEQTLKA